MTGKVIDSGANRTLLAILPIALAIIVLFVAWPFFLGLFVVGLGWKFWQTHQWRKLSRQINPFFSELIRTNQGCLTVLDISVKSNVSAATAQWYLERKAEEYGAVRRLYEKQGIVYYFLTANALGSIFDDSEPESEELTPKKNPSLAESPSMVDKKEIKTHIVNVATKSSEEISTETEERQTATITVEKINVDSESQLQSNAPLEEESPTEAKSLPDHNLENAYSGLTQSDLAKRLEVHSSTIGKRKLDADFDLWSQSKDPDGIAWRYIEESKVFITVESEFESS